MDDDNDALKDLHDMLQHETMTKEELKYVHQMIAAIKGGANRNKKKELLSVRVVGVTCLASTFSVLEGNCFPIVFLDECSQMLEPLSLLPIGKYGCSKLIAVGDPMQLPPTLRSGSNNNGDAGETGLEKTLFLRLVFLGFTPLMLRTQYRCHPTLSGIVNDLFYHHRLLDGITADQRAPLVARMPALLFCDSEQGKERVDKFGSFMNAWEADVVVKLILMLLNRGIEGHQIGVICLYKAQVKKVQDLLRLTMNKAKPQQNANDAASAGNNSNNTKDPQQQLGASKSFQFEDLDVDVDDFFDDSWKEKLNSENPDDNSSNDISGIINNNNGDDDDDNSGRGSKSVVADRHSESNNVSISPNSNIDKTGNNNDNDKNEELLRREDVQISTVDAFQGAEKEIIILSCSRTSRLGFSDSPNRLNVAITRAKRHLVIVGQQKLMCTSGIWQRVIREAKKSAYGIQNSESVVYGMQFDFER